MSTRLNVHKTYKMYVGGTFIRRERGRYLPALTARGRHLENICHGSRKDFRDAVVVARSSFEGWAKKSAYLRGQILYRAAEMLERRAGELVEEIARGGVSSQKAKQEVTASIDRLVYYAGWTDKYVQLFGAVNPVASSHFNFTMPEPTGVVVIAAPDEPALISLVSLIAPAILSGNSVVALASDRYPLPAVTFSEILATSDLPGGVVNLLTGKRADLLQHIATHMDVNAVVDGTGDLACRLKLADGAAFNLKRYTERPLRLAEWFGEKAQDPYWILDTIEFKSAWHPIGL